jgi:hypothetical protein
MFGMNHYRAWHDEVDRHELKPLTAIQRHWTPDQTNAGFTVADIEWLASQGISFERDAR